MIERLLRHWYQKSYIMRLERGISEIRRTVGFTGEDNDMEWSSMGFPRDWWSPLVGAILALKQQSHEEQQNALLWKYNVEPSLDRLRDLAALCGGPTERRGGLVAWVADHAERQDEMLQNLQMRYSEAVAAHSRIEQHLRNILRADTEGVLQSALKECAKHLAGVEARV